MALDDKLSKYIPEFESMQVRKQDGSIVPVQTPITIEHLFTMSAGFDYNGAAAPIKAAREARGNTLDIVRAMSKVRSASNRAPTTDTVFATTFSRRWSRW